jgi:hypothetical protein
MNKNYLILASQMPLVVIKREKHVKYINHIAKTSSTLVGELE